MDSSRFVIRGLVIVLMTWFYWSAYATLMQKGPIGECRKTATCKCEYENGWVVDLSPLNNSERFNKLLGSNGYYYYNVSLCASFSGLSCEGATVCQYEFLQGVSSFTCGRLPNASFLREDNILSYVMTGGDNGRASHIGLQCTDDKVESTMEMLEETRELECVFLLKSSHACPRPPPPLQ